MIPRLKAYLQLCRPANLPTAAADVLAGTAISGLFAVEGAFQMADIEVLPFLLLVMASVFLYAGGVVLNDVFDIEIDRVERPERPIPRARERTISAHFCLRSGWPGRTSPRCPRCSPWRCGTSRPD